MKELLMVITLAALMHACALNRSDTSRGWMRDARQPIHLVPDGHGGFWVQQPLNK